MALRHNRAQIYAADDRWLSSTTPEQALSRVDRQEAEIISLPGRPLKIRLHERRSETRENPATGTESIPALTDFDMERNADAVLRRRKNASWHKVRNWENCHDKHAVTISAGKLFIPDAAAAAKRVKEMKNA